ncbi:MAG: HNH endonuclease [Gemmatimonadetes bacterium]|jgi:hypothetical protein|nr:HNH endonuclease [Gemmatimonadota bacterium]
MSERDYKREYEQYHSQPQQMKERAMRNKWNRRLSPPAGKEIDHRRALRDGGSNDRSNLRFRSVSANRADNGHTKSANYHRAVWAAFADELAQLAQG